MGLFSWIYRQAEEKGQLHGQLVAMVSEKARLEAQCDFLAQRVNILEAERGVLLERLLGIAVPVPEISREATPERRMGPIDLSTLPVRGVPMPEGERGRIFSPDPAEQALESSRAIFEDVGDDRANALGISHTDDGSVRYQ